MRRMYVLVALIALTGCASASSDTTAATPTATGHMREGVLGGDPDLEGGCVWLDTGQERLEIVWPEGYRITADPIELRDPTGAVVATAGDRIRVRGDVAADVMSTCQIGRTWNVEDVQAVR
jgi:hypothetical protein